MAVEASTTSLSTGERVVTNEFHYTFTTDDGASLKRYVLPRTYSPSSPSFLVLSLRRAEESGFRTDEGMGERR